MSTATEFNWTIEVGANAAPERASTPLPVAVQEKTAEEPMNLRRWQSAETNRLNAYQWENVTAAPINDDLAHDRPTLVARSRHERANNPMVEGVIQTFSVDVMGRNGPHLIVESENEEYDAGVVHYWKEWTSNLCVDDMSLYELLFRLVGQDFDTGEWLQQIIPMPSLPASEPVKYRLMDIDPMRLMQPGIDTMEKGIVEGVRRDSFGRPIEYYIRDPKKQFSASWADFVTSVNPKPIAVDDIIHVFQSREPGQVRGFPRLASVLQEMADLRDYDAQVLDCARTQANNGMLLYTTDAALIGADPKPFTGKITLERQVAKAAPAGYQVAGQASTQPGAHYIDFRHEKLRSLGRMVNMPLLMILLSAEDSNFSQSRIDINVIYQRGLRLYQKFIELKWLSRLFKIFSRAMMLATSADSTPSRARMLLPPRPKRLNLSWGWEPMGQANPIDHVKAQVERIKLGLTTPAIELAEEGRNEDDILDSLERSNQKRVDRGLPPLPGPDNNQPNSVNDEENEQNKATKSGAAKPAKTATKRQRAAHALANS